MISICFYFEVHQPFRLNRFSFFDIGQGANYFDDRLNQEIVRKVGDKCYLPMTALMLKQLRQRDDISFSFAVTGTAIEQFRNWYPEVLDQFKALADTGRVEFLGETYYHSLSALHSPKEFFRQADEHRDLMVRELGVLPTAFRNTELIYCNAVAELVEQLGYHTILMEGHERALGWRSPNFVYTPISAPRMRALLKNYKLSDDIAFRFSDRNWAEFPLSTEKFAHWIHSLAGNADTVNFFMDFETFGEHQWADSGIFEFMRHLPEALKQHPDFRYQTVSEVARSRHSRGEVDVPEPLSWADMERDVSAWMGNSMQRGALAAIYELEHDIFRIGHEQALDHFRKLQTSDHFYYMCTKFWSDGDVHKYFSPYESPYDAYNYFMNVLHDFRQRLGRSGRVDYFPMPGGEVLAGHAPDTSSVA